MISSFYTAATGAISLQKGFDVTANNIANSATTGYKASQASFADLMYTNIHAAQGADSKLKSGHGTKLQTTNTLFAEGNLQPTGRSLDFALTGEDGFFAVQTGGEIKYTRNGSFHLSVENGVNYLAAEDGGYVLNPNGQRITVNQEDEDINVGVFAFQNKDGLVRDGNSYFVPGDNSGAVANVNNAGIKRKSLEGSGVNLTDEMSSVIQLQRAFQFNSKVVQISDEIMQTVNSLR